MSWKKNIPVVDCGNQQTFEELYIVGELLATGGVSRVFEGIRISDNIRVALKYIPCRSIINWDDNYGVQVPTEISALLKLRESPGIIKFYEFFYFKGEIIISMEKPDNCMDLRDFINQETNLNEYFARHFFKQIVEAFSLCYKAGIFHLDIVAQNILVDIDTKKTFLLDFGCIEKVSCERSARSTGSDTELLSKKKFHGEDTTVKKIGFLLYYMLVGENPTETETLFPQKEFMSMPNISKACKELIITCVTTYGDECPTLDEILNNPWITNKDIEETLPKYPVTFLKEKPSASCSKEQAPSCSKEQEPSCSKEQEPSCSKEQEPSGSKEWASSGSKERTSSSELPREKGKKFKREKILEKESAKKPKREKK